MSHIFLWPCFPLYLCDWKTIKRKRPGSTGSDANSDIATNMFELNVCIYIYQGLTETVPVLTTKFQRLTTNYTIKVVAKRQGKLWALLKLVRVHLV